MKVYLAARYSRREEMEGYANILKARGHNPTCTWAYGGEEGKSYEEIALLDLKDVLRADILIFFAEPYGSKNKGGGRHTEFGIAYASGIPCVVVGDEAEQVFHSLPGVEFREDFWDAATLLESPDFINELRRITNQTMFENYAS